MQYHKKVILFPVGKWRFWDYLHEPNKPDTNPIEDWYQNNLSEDAQFQFDSILKNCRKTEDHTQWVGFKKFLKGKFKDERVWELTFKADKRQYRVLGIFGGKRREAILLIGCYHKGGNYTPTNALDTACKRARAFREGKAGIYERIIHADF